MSPTTYIIFAWGAVALGLGGYLAWMLMNNARLTRRRKQMEMLSDD